MQEELKELKAAVCRANLLLKEYDLVSLTWGNVSGIDRAHGLVVIKPSGVSYEDLRPENMVVVDLASGSTVEGELAPSSDTPTHLELYRNFPNIGGVVHTHSLHATAFAQAKCSIPALGTTHADHFYGEIPCTRDMSAEEIDTAYELNTGRVIVQAFADKDPDAIPSVLVASHGVFSWGSNPQHAVENALVTEKVAQMALYGKVLSPAKASIASELLDKHYLRKHGANAYYGQKQEHRSAVESRFAKISGKTDACICGKRHEITLKELRMHSGAIQELPRVIAKLGNYQRMVMICDRNTYRAAGERVESLCHLAHTVCLDPDDLHANEHGVAAAEQDLPANCDLLVAVGSGTVHDITRYIAYRRGIPFVSVPTAASVDGYVSTMAAMTWNGAKKTLTAVAPIAMVADSDILAAAPKALTAAGVGDLLGKYTALFDWKIGHILTDEYECPEIIRLEEEALHEVVENIERIAACDTNAMEMLMYGLVLSGLAMQMCGYSRPASGAEHHISHLIEMGVFNRPNSAYHGEKVGVATAIVCDRYHAMRRLQVSDLHFSCQSAMTEKEICDRFGALSSEILKENANEPLHAVTETRLREKWDEICRRIDRLPTGDTIRNLLHTCGGSTTLEDIGLSSDMEDLLFRYSPMVRCRLTLARICGWLKQ